MVVFLDFLKNNILQILNIFLGIGILSAYLILFNKHENILIEKHKNEIKKLELKYGNEIERLEREKEFLKQKTVNEKVDTINNFKEYAENINNLLNLEKEKNINLTKEFTTAQTIINNIMIDYSIRISDLLLHYNLKFDDISRLIEIVEFIYQKNNKISNTLIEALSVTLLTAKFEHICIRVLDLLNKLDKKIVANYILANYVHISHSNITFFKKYFKNNWDDTYITIIKNNLADLSNREEIIKKPLLDLLNRNK